MGGKRIASLLGSLCRKKSPPGSSDEASTSSNDGGEGKSQASDHKSLPLPPGKRKSEHHRAASFQQPDRRSTSGASNLASSLSMRLITGQSFRREGKKMEYEDSLWKKPIILGEKCRILDEEDDAVLYDENGNRISTYHRRSTASLMSSPRRSSSNEEEEDQSPKKLGVGQN